jgi:REP element-mobilizing transposase RayT
LQRVGSRCVLMPKNLRRETCADLHCITFCCCQRRAMLGTVRMRNLAVRILGEVRSKYGFTLVGYVIMPEHVHLLIGESRTPPPAKVVKIFKQRVSRQMREKKRRDKQQLRLRFPEEAEGRRSFWQRRYYDFNVYTRRKIKEKLECHGEFGGAPKELAVEQLVVVHDGSRIVEGGYHVREPEAGQELKSPPFAYPTRGINLFPSPPSPTV